ncbi:hypothetical protein M5W76_22245, partial [Paenibacillus larvae]
VFRIVFPYGKFIMFWSELIVSGKQDWKDIILKTVLNDNVTYIPNSMTGTLPNGTTGALDDSWWSGQFWPLICLI